MTLQDLIFKAVDEYLQDAEISDDIRIDQQRETERLRATLPSNEFLALVEKRRWVEIWIEFMRELPEQTVAAQRQLIQDSLKFFRSSRLKR